MLVLVWNMECFGIEGEALNGEMASALVPVNKSPMHLLIMKSNCSLLLKGKSQICPQWRMEALSKI